MDELRHAMHAAVADPPPARIDLDRLIEHTRRRTRLQYRLGMAAGTVAVLAGALVVPALAPSVSGMTGAGGSGPPGPCPQVTPTTTYRPDRRSEPLPDEPCGAVELRLLYALTGALHTEMPGWTLEDADNPGQPVAFLRQAVDSSPDGYVASVQLRQGEDSRIVLIWVSAHGPSASPTVEQRADDTLGGSRGEIGGYEITDIRPDGTTVTVLGSRSLGADRLTRIARTPGLTLFP